MHKRLISEFSKEQILRRMIDHAVEKWRIKENEYDALDPVVKLLFEACALEMEKVAMELAESNKRILEQMAKLFAPGYERPVPACTIMYARPNISHYELDPGAEFEIQSDALSLSKKSGKNAALRFSPVMNHHLYDGYVKYMVHHREISQLDPLTQKKQKLSDTSDLHALDPSSVWLGIQLDQDIKHLNDLVIFLDWLGPVSVDQRKAYLGGVELFINGILVAHEFGILNKDKKSYSFRELAVFQEMEQRLESIFRQHQNQFITLIPDISTESNPHETTPGLFSEFDEYIYSDPGTKLVWLEIRFQAVAHGNFIDQMFAYINCFPVLNRTQDKITYRTNKLINIIPIQSEDALFFAIESVTNAEQKHYYQTPPLGENKAGQYAIQFQTNRFDELDAMSLLKQLKDRLYDDANRFNALGIPFIKGFVDELQTVTSRLDERLKESGFQKSEQPYLVIWPENPGEFIYVSYWTTLGSYANDILPGTKAVPYSTSYIYYDQCVVLKKSWGGIDTINEDSELYAFKQALLDRSGYLTEQRIRSICRSYVGDSVGKIVLSKSIKAGKGASGGLIKVYTITMQTSKESANNPDLKSKAKLAESELQKHCGFGEEVQISFTSS